MSLYYEEVQKELFSLQDLSYQKFNAKLIPNLRSETIIGIRIPLLRKMAKRLWKEQPEKVREYLKHLPHFYLEENHLHAFLIEEIHDFSTCIQETVKFLPYIDNWATCDCFSPKIFRKYPKEVYEFIQRCLYSSHPYTVRYGVGLLLSNYLDEYFSSQCLEQVAKIHSEEYYVNMMIAWYFATALAKQYASTIAYLEEHLLSSWIHQKTIQKAIESRRISEGTKQYLRTLRIQIKEK